jgi:hypothetical protein
MTDEHDGRARMPLGEVPYTGDHTRLHSREGLATGWGTGRIRLPLVVTGGGVRAARQNLGAAQAFPRPHRGFDEPWFGDEGTSSAVQWTAHGPPQSASPSQRLG